LVGRHVLAIVVFYDWRLSCSVTSGRKSRFHGSGGNVILILLAPPLAASPLRDATAMADAMAAWSMAHGLGEILVQDV
jgi:hypothetical protein